MQASRRLYARAGRARPSRVSVPRARSTGRKIELEPTQALLECVYRAAGQAAWLQQRLQSLSNDEILSRGAHGALVPHTWVRMEQQAIDRLARVSKMALDSGVAERQVRIAERTGQLIAAALEEAIAPLTLADHERDAVVKRYVSTFP